MDNEKTKELSNQNGMLYKGKVTVSFLDNGRLIAANSCCNSGSKKLFNFFSSCLQGNWASAKNERPNKIVLFSDDTDAFYDHPASSAIVYDSAPTVEVKDKETSVTFHFRIPFLYLKQGATIKKLCLYPPMISSLQNDMLAYVTLADAERFTIPDSGGNMTTIVDWKMTVENVD